MRGSRFWSATTVVVAVALIWWAQSRDTTSLPRSTTEIDSRKPATTPGSAASVAKRVEPRQYVLELVDKNTKLPVANCRVVIGERDATTDTFGRLTIPEEIAEVQGQVHVRPRDGFAFKATTATTRSSTTALLVDGQFRIQLRGPDQCATELRELGELDTVRAGFTRSVGGFPVGPPIHRWNKLGEHLVSTATAPLVVAVLNGTIKPSHPVWSGESKVDKDGQRHVRLPEKVTRPRISPAISARPGAVYTFDVAKETPGTTIEYLLTTASTRPVSVQLIAVRAFGESDSLIQLLAQETVSAGDPSATFENVPAGHYILRSAATRDGNIDLSWQETQIKAGHTLRLTESGGHGTGVLWLSPPQTDTLVMDFSCGKTANASITYGTFEIGGARSIRGLHGTDGSIRVLQRQTQAATRHMFDLTASVRLTIND